MSFSDEQNASGFGGQPDKNPTTEQRNFRNQVDKTKPHWYMNIEHNTQTKQGGIKNENCYQFLGH